MSSETASVTVEVKPRVGNYRWMICALLLFAAIINYVDRQIIGILKPTLVAEFGWSDERIYSSIVFCFQLAYAIGFLFAGRFMDKVGVRFGFAIAVSVWSLAAMAHGLAHYVKDISIPVLNLDKDSGFMLVTLVGGAAGLAIARFALGIGEAGAFPASIKTVAEWFPKKERAFATGIFNSGTNVGALIAPLVVPWILSHWGWQWAFIGTGIVGFIWVAWWLAVYRPPEDHPRLKPAELAYIRSDPVDPPAKISWLKLLTHRQTWAFALGKFLTDPIWWLYLFWLPDFLNKTHGVEVTVSKMGPPLLAIYLIADIGSVGGGWLSSHWIKKGWTTNKSRKMAMLICALAVVPIIMAAKVSNLWVSVLLISIAASAHQGWSANLFSVVSDTMPKEAISSVVGLGGFLCFFTGGFVNWITGNLLQKTGSYLPVFLYFSGMYIISLLAIQLLVPKIGKEERA